MLFLNKIKKAKINKNRILALKNNIMFRSKEKLI